jgi:hypothetical protein
MDIQTIVNSLQNSDLLTYIFICVLCIVFIQLFDTKLILSIGIFLFILVHYETIMKGPTIPDTLLHSTNKGDITTDMYYNTKVHDILVQLKPFKKYNKISYKSGVIYMRKFFKTVRILEIDTRDSELYVNTYDTIAKQAIDKLKYENSYIKNYNQYFENATLYLKTAINHFQSITVSLPERSFIKGLKHGDFETTQKTNTLSRICKELYNECYYILLNMSIKFNKEWSEKPHIYIKEIDMNTDRVEHYQERDEVHWALY